MEPSIMWQEDPRIKGVHVSVGKDFFDNEQILGHLACIFLPEK